MLLNVAFIALQVCVCIKRGGRNKGYGTSASTAMGEHMRQAQGTEDVCKPISKQMGQGVASARRGLLASKVRNVRMNQGLPIAEHGHTYCTRTQGRYAHTDTLSTLSDSQRTYFPLLLFFFFFLFVVSHQATLHQTK